MKSEVLTPDLRVGSKVYSQIRAGEPVESHDGVIRVPFFDGDTFLWNLIELHPDLSPLHFTASAAIPTSDGNLGGRIIEGLIRGGSAIQTPYSYRNPRASEATPVLLAAGALKRFLEDPSSGSVGADPTVEAPKTKSRASKPAPKVTGSAYQVFFIDDVSIATPLSEPLATYEEAVQWEKDYWIGYFEEHPGTTLYFCGSEVRSVFIPEETP